MPMRITGMSSGMDIDKMVSDLMKAERMPLDKMKQQRTVTNWKMDAYREINTKLANLRKSAEDLRFASEWNFRQATSSNTSIVTVTASDSATATSHTVVVNGSVATGAKMTSGSQISNVGLEGSSAANLSINQSNNSFNVTLNGVTKTIILETDPAKVNYTDYGILKTELQKKMDAAFGSNKVAVNFDNATGKFNFTPAGFQDATVNNKPQMTLSAVSGNNGLNDLGFNLSEISMPSYKLNRNEKLSNLNNAGKFAVPLASNSGSFTINGQQISYSGSDTLNTIISKVNSSAAGVVMSYDEISDKVVFTSKQMGSSAKVEVGSDIGGLLASLKIDTAAPAAVGSDVEVTIDGVTTKRDSNTFTVDGVTYTVNGPGTTTVTVSNDSDAAVKAIKDFVDTYNSTVELINTKLKEPKYKDYAPLSEDQKKDMKDSDIKLWEDKAKSGLLQSDDILKRVLTDLRSYLSTSVTNVSPTMNALYKIGIETVPYDPKAPQNSGKLQLDENKLRQSLSEDPDAVKSLFSNQSETASDVGVAQKMYARISKSIDELITKAGAVGSSTTDRNTDLGLAMFNFNQKIVDFEGKLKKKENQYYLRFSAMEKAMQNGNAQIAWLSQQMGRG